LTRKIRSIRRGAKFDKSRAISSIRNGGPKTEGEFLPSSKKEGKEEKRETIYQIKGPAGAHSRAKMLEGWVRVLQKGGRGSGEARNFQKKSGSVNRKREQEKGNPRKGGIEKNLQR